MFDIKDQAIKDGTFMKAPNGKPTNLNERQWLQVRTQAFKDWFGDWEKLAKLELELKGDFYNTPEYQEYLDLSNDVSKVRDPETHEPIVVYHSRPRGTLPIQIFQQQKGYKSNKYFYFSNDKKTAQTYVKNHITFSDISHKAHLIDSTISTDSIESILTDINIIEKNIKDKIFRLKNELENYKIQPIGFVDLKTGKSIDFENVRTKSTIRQEKYSLEDKLNELAYLKEITIAFQESKEYKNDVDYYTQAVFLNIRESDSVQLNAKGADWHTFNIETIGLDYDFNPEVYARSFKPDNQAFIITNFKDSSYEKDPNIGLSTTYAVKNSNQIKSATDNNGRFSKYNNNINLQAGSQQTDDLTPNDKLSNALIDLINKTENLQATLVDEKQIDEIIENGDAELAVIGEKGAAAMDKAEEATTRMDNLAVANDMEKAGKDALTIKQATGWERGADGKWRYEVVDFKVNGKKISKALQIGDPISLFDIVGDDYRKELETLQKAYPWIINVEIDFKSQKDLKSLHMNNTLGYVTEGSKKINLNKGFLKWDYNTGLYRVVADYGKALGDTIIHELQHLIQHEEGFSIGAYNKLNTNQQYDKAARIWKNQLMRTTAYAKLKKLFESLSKFNLQLSKGGGFVYIEDKEDVFNRHTFDLTKINTENVDNIEGVDEVSQKKLKRILLELANAYKNINEPTIDQTVYNADAGEVEARAAARRRTLSAKEKRKSLFTDEMYKDVAKEDLIFLEDGLNNIDFQIQKRELRSASLEDMSQNEYAEWLKDNGKPIGTESDTVYDLLTARKQYRGENFKNRLKYYQENPETVKNLSRFLQDVDAKFLQGIIKIDGVRASSKGAGWNHFIINEDSKHSEETHKGYITLYQDAVLSLTTEEIAEFLKSIQESGFNGQVKFPETGGRMLFSFDNFVIHGQTKEDVDKAMAVAEKYWGDKIEATQRGLDRKGTSHTDVLAKEVEDAIKSGSVERAKERASQQEATSFKGNSSQDSDANPLGKSTPREAQSEKQFKDTKKNTDSIKNVIRKIKNRDVNIDVSSNVNRTLMNIADKLNFRYQGQSSYTKVSLPNGDVATIRLGNHKANGNNFNTDINFSIVIESKIFNNIPSQIQYLEYVCSENNFLNNKDAVVAEIVRGIESIIDEGHFIENSKFFSKQKENNIDKERRKKVYDFWANIVKNAGFNVRQQFNDELRLELGEVNNQYGAGKHDGGFYAKNFNFTYPSKKECSLFLSEVSKSNDKSKYGVVNTANYVYFFERGRNSTVRPLACIEINSIYDNIYTNNIKYANTPYERKQAIDALLEQIRTNPDGAISDKSLHTTSEKAKGNYRLSAVNSESTSKRDVQTIRLGLRQVYGRGISEKEGTVRKNYWKAILRVRKKLDRERDSYLIDFLDHLANFFDNFDDDRPKRNWWDNLYEKIENLEANNYQLSEEDWEVIKQMYIDTCEYDCLFKILKRFDPETTINIVRRFFKRENSSNREGYKAHLLFREANLGNVTAKEIIKCVPNDYKFTSDYFYVCLNIFENRIDFLTKDDIETLKGYLGISRDIMISEDFYSRINSLLSYCEAITPEQKKEWLRSELERRQLTSSEIKSLSIEDVVNIINAKADELIKIHSDIDDEDIDDIDEYNEWSVADAYSIRTYEDLACECMRIHENDAEKIFNGIKDESVKRSIARLVYDLSDIYSNPNIRTSVIKYIDLQTLINNINSSAEVKYVLDNYNHDDLFNYLNEPIWEEFDGRETGYVENNAFLRRNKYLFKLAKIIYEEYKDRFAKPKDGTLIGVRNVKIDNLKQLIDGDVMINPSIALINASNYTHREYGDVTILIKPSIIRDTNGTDIFDGDAWTPALNLHTDVKRKLDRGQITPQEASTILAKRRNQSEAQKITLNEAKQRVGLLKEISEDLLGFVSKRTSGTNYFEAKVNYNLHLDEAAVAIVMPDEYQEIGNTIKNDYGLPIYYNDNPHFTQKSVYL